jgi:virginiamycin B lyase
MPSRAGATSTAPRNDAVRATLRIVIPRATRRVRRPRFVSPETQSTVIAFTPTSGKYAQAVVFAFDLTPQSNPACSHPDGDLNYEACDLTLDMQPGYYNASMSTYDGLLNSKNQPTGDVLSADIGFPLAIGYNSYISVTLYGVPARLAAWLPQPNGELQKTGTTGLTVPVNATGTMQLAITGKDALGEMITGVGAPVPSLTTSDPYVAIAPPSSGVTPNIFTLQVVGTPPVGHVATLFAQVTPDSASGAGPVKVSLSLAFAPPIPITEFPSPVGGSSITAGPDGNLWFTGGQTIWSMTTAGVLGPSFLVPLPTNGYPGLRGITVGPDGAFWFGGYAYVGRMTTKGAVTEYPARISPGGKLATGSDGALWFTAYGIVERITTTGSLTTFRSNGNNGSITAGPDGALWFTKSGPAQIARITTSGIISLFNLPVVDAVVTGIAAGPDGALWFIGGVPNAIGRITTAGHITEFPLPTPAAGANSMVAGPDGAMWFTEGANRIGRITMQGAITEFIVPTAETVPWGLTVGPDGNIWFVEANDNNIGRLTLPN